MFLFIIVATWRVLAFNIPRLKQKQANKSENLSAVYIYNRTHQVKWPSLGTLGGECITARCKLTDTTHTDQINGSVSLALSISQIFSVFGSIFNAHAEVVSCALLFGSFLSFNGAICNSESNELWPERSNK